MRVLRLYIGEYRVLSQLDMRFDPGQPQEVNNRNYHLDFLVGVNGTGKSTVLRLLGRIFKGVQKSFDELSDIPFILEYWLDSQKIKVYISNIHPVEQTPLERYFVVTAPGLNDAYEVGEPDEQHLLDNVPASRLPDRIIAYTTGNEAEWVANFKENGFENSSLGTLKSMPAHERSLRELSGWLKRTDSAGQDQQAEDVRFRLILRDQLALVALTGLLQHCACAGKESPLLNVLDKTGIHKLAGFTLDLSLPYITQAERENLWQQIGQYSTRSVQSGSVFRLVYDLTNTELAGKLLELNGGALAFFETLAGWSNGENPILTKVTLLVERIPFKTKKEDDEVIIPPMHTWNWLSDDERSFIGRMCLFSLFGEVESLILLDEPEVHFNDYWKRHIVSTMHQVLEKKNGTAISHVLVATHSSISLSDVHPEDILVLERQDLVTSATSIPRIQTFGADPSEIMVHVFGAPYAEGAYSVNEIENWLAEISQKTEQEQRDYLKTVAPGYWAYRIRREMTGVSLK